MVRGCQKRIVYLKNTGSDVFDEAYFLVKEKYPADEEGCDLVKEATRILDECTLREVKRGRVARILGFVKTVFVPFLVGILFGIVIVILIN